MKANDLYNLKDELHAKIEEAFSKLESHIPKEKGVDVDLTKLAGKAWDQFNDGIAEISKVAGEAYATYVDQRN
ncbi:hypothetical protein [Tenacibaculum xiamenense]|uniref:hypothetical protein n=1 Tax=Tenacibaculum xiamenense TaxID=1261553 RepID=UPI003894EA80